MNKEEIVKEIVKYYPTYYDVVKRLIFIQQENKQLKEMFEDSKTYTKEHLYKYNKDLLEANKKLLEENKQLKEQIKELEEYKWKYEELCK